jgi:hypothetical protein
MITIVNTADILPTTQAVQDDINTQNVNIQPKCKEFKACVAQDKTLVHKGNVFAYNNHNNEVQCNNINLILLAGLQVHH